jgi:DnaJ-domain-containing protein 1
VTARIPRWQGSSPTLRMVLARLDGTLDVTDIAALTGLSEEAVEETLQPLIEAGVLAVGDTASPTPGPTTTTPRRASGEFSMPPPDALPKISEEESHRIQEFYSKLNKMDHYRLLGCAATADTKDIKRAYFALAKLYHPDRFFRKDVGALKPKIDAIFAAMTNALDTLTDAERRAAYDAYLREVLKTRITRRNAEALEARRDFVAAAEIWARVVESLPTDAYVQHRQAYALLRGGVGFDIAIAAATRAIELDPLRSEYRITAASLYIAAGRERMALGELDAACELEPDRQDWIGLRAAIAAKVDAQRIRESIPG